MTTVFPGQLPAAGGVGDLTPDLLQSDYWSDQMVAAAGIPIVDVPFLTVGGGIGSFVTVDYLRIAGVPTSHIKVLSNLDSPGRRTSTSPASRRSRARSGSSLTPHPGRTISGASRRTRSRRRSGSGASDRPGR